MNPILEVQRLEVVFPRRNGGVVNAVRNVSFAVAEGTVLAIVGESGSGKTSVLRAMVGLLPEPGRVSGGRALYRGTDLLRLRKEELRRVRGRQIATVLQDPLAYLDPIQTIGMQFTETFKSHFDATNADARLASVKSLTAVGMEAPEAVLRAHPFEFSRGALQRIGVALAMLCDPEIVLADEPTTGLDLLVQAQVLNQLSDLKKSRRLSMVLITHDMAVAAYLADFIMVMYAGTLVEYGDRVSVLTEPKHHYTVGLIRSVPQVDQPKDVRLNVIPGFPPDLSGPLSGCPFAPRCGARQDVCLQTVPSLQDVGDGHFAACHFPNEKAAPESPPESGLITNGEERGRAAAFPNGLRP